MTAYYNEFDPDAAAWLRELIKRGAIAPGYVDERSILDVQPDDLTGYTQCHFFAGISGWSYALRLAGWSDDRPVWTGSPPCQPFSPAGKGLSKDDPRHLAPHFVQLVRSCRPPVLFGEQVASAAVFGKSASGAKRATGGAPEWAWFDDLSDRLEAAHYAVGAGDIPAAGIGAPHIRQRCFFGAVRLADAAGCGHQPCSRDAGICDAHIGAGTSSEQRGTLRTTCGVADAMHTGRPERWTGAGNGSTTRSDGARGMADAECDGRNGAGNIGTRWRDEPANERDARGLADADDAGPQGRLERGNGADQRASWEAGVARGVGHRERPDAHDSPWRDADWLFCRDGKWRPVESGTFPLAHGIPARVGRLRGYGNAIVPQAGAAFIKAFCVAAGL